MAHTERLTTRAEREAFRSAKRACYAGLDSITLRTELARRLAPAVPMEAYSFATTDPDTGLLTHGVGEGLSVNIARAYLERAYPEEVALLSMDRIRMGDPVISVAEVSPALREVLQGEGFAAEINLLCATGGELWGSWCMIRGASSRTFNPRETALARLIAPHIGRGLRSAALLDAAQSERAEPQANAPGVLILDARGRTVLRNGSATAHLTDLADVGFQTQDLPFAVASVLYRLYKRHRYGAAGAEAATEDAELRVRGRSGEWYRLCASFTEPDEAGQSSAIILIEPLVPRDMAPILTRLYGLSLREREVLTLVVRGASTKQIASQLKISAYTVQDHLDKACDRVGVRGRRALVAKLWFDGYAPRL